VPIGKLPCEIVRFYEIETSDDAIRAALERTLRNDNKKTRINKGVSGRGRRDLTENQRREVEAPPIPEAVRGLRRVLPACEHR
jgi:hypothetical protein